jgi:hypothetical protein
MPKSLMPYQISKPLPPSLSEDTDKQEGLQPLIKPDEVWERALDRLSGWFTRDRFNLLKGSKMVLNRIEDCEPDSESSELGSVILLSTIWQERELSEEERNRIKFVVRQLINIPADNVSFSHI